MIPRSGLAELAPIRPVPVRHCRFGIGRRPTSRRRIREHFFVVLLGGLEWIRTHDLCARIVAVAIAPSGGRGGCMADRRSFSGAPLSFEPCRRVASEVPRIAPEVAVLVEVAGREDVARQRRDASRDSAVFGCEDRHRALGEPWAESHSFPVRSDDHVYANRSARAATDGRLRRRERNEATENDGGEGGREPAFRSMSHEFPPATIRRRGPAAGVGYVSTRGKDQSPEGITKIAEKRRTRRDAAGGGPARTHSLRREQSSARSRGSPRFTPS